MKTTLVIAGLAALSLGATALAQGLGSGSGAPMQHMQHKGSSAGKGSGAGQPPHADHGAAKGDAGPSSAAFRAANDKMHRDMDIVFSGDADVDFVKGMIPHHQGAIDMAKVVLAHGKSAEIRKLAEEIIKAQEGEIAMMQEWLRKSVK